MTEKFWIHVPIIDAESEDTIRRVASAFLVLQNVAEVAIKAFVGPESEFNPSRALMGMEFADRMANAGAELQSTMTALCYGVSGYNLQEFVEQQRGFEPPTGRVAAKMGDELRRLFPEVDPK